MALLSPQELAKKLRAKLVKSEMRADVREALAVSEQLAAAPGPAVSEFAAPRLVPDPKGLPDWTYGPLADLLSQVFGTKFVAMPVVQASIERYLSDRQVQPSVDVVRPGFLRIQPKGLFQAGSRRETADGEQAVFRGPLPVDGVYAVWYDDRSNTLLVPVGDEGFELGRSLYRTALERGIEVSSLARERYEPGVLREGKKKRRGARGVVRSPRPARPSKVFRWRWHTFDLLGDGQKNPWDINEVHRTSETVELDEALFSSARPVRSWRVPEIAEAILQAMRGADILNAGATPSRIALDIEEDTIRLTDKEIRDRPIGELRRESEILD